ncbi:hypothetical protein VB712_14210 [Spirulina sp. CCNP1310]|uniref:hypothetical protein n=1 Tax=Spirulina sp. CCNP1310 TaxID=3110249 RepID=UPI002B207B71|nr:hypothetical protein [Spirulina sp. CCNP1310]MEA5420382.1 hypothetical protein [Spirulina sp. CCNP1310]
MSNLPQDAVEELFDRVAHRYFELSLPDEPTSNQKLTYQKQLDKIAREFIRIQRNLSDRSEQKFFALYFAGTIRFNQGKYQAAYRYLTQAKQLYPEKAYIFMDMYAGCVHIILSRKEQYVDAINAAHNCFREGILAAKSNADQETYQRIQEAYEYFFNQKCPF